MNLLTKSGVLRQGRISSKVNWLLAPDDVAPAHGSGVFVGKGGDEGVGVGGRGVGVSVGSGVSVGVLVGVAVGVGVGLSVGVSVGLLVGVAVGVGVAATTVVGVALGSVVASGAQAARAEMHSSAVNFVHRPIGRSPGVCAIAPIIWLNAQSLTAKERWHRHGFAL
jgi:hypothetical protein